MGPWSSSQGCTCIPTQMPLSSQQCCIDQAPPGIEGASHGASAAAAGAATRAWRSSPQELSTPGLQV